MITKEELEQAISECQGQKNPTAQTCIKLAAYYTILDHTDKPPENIAYSFANKPPDIVNYEGESDFAQAIQGRNPNEVWALIDELVQTIQIVHPRLYDGFMRKLT